LIIANKELTKQNAEKEKRAAELTRVSLETARRLQHIQALHKIDMAISESFDLRSTLKVILDQAVAGLEVDAAALLLLDPYAQSLHYAAGLGFRTREVEGRSLPLGEGRSGLAALERRTLITPVLKASDLGPGPLMAKEGFVSHCAAPLITKGRVEGVLEIFHRSRLSPEKEWLEFLETLAGQAAMALESVQLFDALQRTNIELSQAYDATIDGWSHALDLRDRETEGHTQRVTEITVRLARVMGIGDAELVHVRRGALLHDIGKMGVSDSILLKPGPLTDDGWTQMRDHPRVAYDLLSRVAYLKPALDIPYCHHEKWDGTGYPRGLKGEQIPFAARIFSVVDVWDALNSDRPYRLAWTAPKAREYILSESGKHFDPQVVEAFSGMMAAEGSGPATLD
jgi:putative nucleotidyltransferase with HDIG domain